jgi:hypothetical protein
MSMATQPNKPEPEKDAPEQARELPLAPPDKKAADRPAAPPTDADPLQRWREAREIEDEMSEMFDEDRVTHKHGSAEPESD